MLRHLLGAIQFIYLNPCKMTFLFHLLVCACQHARAHTYAHTHIQINIHIHTNTGGAPSEGCDSRHLERCHFE